MTFGKNDVCALGFIIEEMFGTEKNKEIDELVGKMTDPDPETRISAGQAADFIEKLRSRV